VSPAQITNPELYQDRFVQHWHRRVFPTDWWAIDVDLVGVCKKCRRPLYWIESTTNPNKPLTIMRQIESPGVPGIVIIHDTQRIIEARWVSGENRIIGGETELSITLEQLRTQHICGGAIQLHNA
jgi:hypothetical protein